MKKILFSLLFCAIFASISYSQEILDLNTALMRSTFKLEGSNKSIGTVFILGVPTKADKKILRYALVTAAHVLNGASGDEAILHLRVKKENEYVRRLHSIRIRESGTNLYVKNPEADVAACFVALPTDTDMELISANQVLAEDDFVTTARVHPGDQLFALGFPLGNEANDSGFPILRSGAIASYPLMPLHDIKTFLMDFQVFRGNSGGPVLFYQTNRFIEGKFAVVSYCRIMGLVSQERIVTEQLQSLEESRQVMHSLATAVIVNASLIRETLDLLEKAHPE